MFGQKWLYSGKVVAFGQKMVVFCQSCYIRVKWWYSGKVVLFGQKFF